MNINRAFDVSLPELPSRRYREIYFRFDQQTVARVHHEPNQTIVRALAPSSKRIMNFSLKQWEVVQQFDGKRSYEELAAWWKENCGVQVTPAILREFAEALDKVNFWLKTPQEESIAMMEALREKRREREKPINDFSRTYITVFDPDKVLTAIYRAIRWVYRPWFVALTLCGMVWMLFTWFSHSSDVWRDSLSYWNMTQKGWRDVLEFYLIFLVVGFFHESGHAFTVKHFGGEVRRMGIVLVYTTPAFFVDMSQIWLYRSRRERCLNTLAGFWFELTACIVATAIWTGTPPGTGLHNLAYKFVLVGGIMPVLFNMNPLAKLDGYIFFCELFRLPNLRERSTAFLTAWIRKTIFRMPVSVPSLAPRRAIFFALWAFFSGIYTYLFLLFLGRLTYRVCYHFSPQWAFLPATLVTLRIFKSRIVTFMQFLKALYLDKKVLVRTHPYATAAVAAAGIILLFLPLWHESIDAPFVLEPAQRAVIRADSPAEVEQVMVREGQHVDAGAELARLRNFDVESAAAKTQSEMQTALAHTAEAQLRYIGVGDAEAERRLGIEHTRIAREQQATMIARSPISGTVVTPRVEDLDASWIGAGTTIAEVQDLSNMRARVFIPEPDMHTLGTITSTSMHIASRVMPLHGQVVSLSAGAQEAEPGLIPVDRYKGTKPPLFYVALVQVANDDGAVKPGIIGDAKVFGRRRSLAGLIAQPAIDFALRKIW